MGLPPGENNAKSCLENKTVQSASHMVPTPTIVLVKDVMMYPVVVKSAANCGVGSVAVSDNLSTFPVAMSTLICEVLVLGGTRGAVGEMYRWVVPESMMLMSLCRINCLAAAVVLVGRVAI